MSKQNGSEFNQQFTPGQTVTVEDIYHIDAEAYLGCEAACKLHESAENEFIEFVQIANRQIYAACNEQQPAIDSLLRRCSEEGRTIRVISQQIREGISLRQILNTTAELTRQFLQADRTVVYRFSENRPAKVIAESHLQNCSSMLGFSMHESSVSVSASSGKINSKRNPSTIEPGQRPYTCGQIEAIVDINAAGLEANHIKLLEFFQIKSLLIAPILESVEEINSEPSSLETKNKVWGLLIAHQCEQNRQWHPFEIEFIASIKAQLEIAVRQSRLQEQVRQINNQLSSQIQKRNAQLQQSLETESVLKRITDQVRDSFDENQILQTAMRELALLLGVEDCNSALYNDDNTTATILSEYTTGPDSYMGKPVQMANLPEIYSQLLKGEHFQFCKLNDPRDSEPKSILACPIFQAGAILGDLWLFKPRQYAFSEVEIRLTQLVANHCAIAIRQVRLYQAAQKQVTELEKLNGLKDDFLSTVSHELRTPLSNMKMAIQMLAIALNQERSFFADLAKPEREKSKVARYYQIVRNECEREIALIEDLLELQQLDTGSTAWAPAIIELDRMIAKLAKTFQQKNLAISAKISFRNAGAVT